MNRLTSRQRQLVYLAGILVLMAPIIVLGMPTSGSGGPLGVISQKRLDYELGEPSLGNVDPASATMNLVLLGMRGIAANILWMEADHLKETKNWSQLESTVESIILLQPHFQSVWKFQAWNLGYNVSAECDAVPDRYFYVKKGMKFLRRGIERNQKVPELDTTWGLLRQEDRPVRRETAVPSVFPPRSRRGAVGGGTRPRRQPLRAGQLPGRQADLHHGQRQGEPAGGRAAQDGDPAVHDVSVPLPDGLRRRAAGRGELRRDHPRSVGDRLPRMDRGVRSHRVRHAGGHGAL